MKRIVSILTTLLATLITTLIAGVAVVLTGPAAVAAVDPVGLDPRVAPSRPVYLALGDSLAAGQASVPPTGSIVSTALQWRARGFVAQLHRDLKGDLDCREDRPGGEPRDGCPRLQLVNISRTGIPGGPGGVTTATMLQPGDQLDRAVALLTERNGNASTRDDVEVLSLTVGERPLRTRGRCLRAQREPGRDLRTGARGELRRLATRYDQILTELRAAAGDDVLILTTTYYNPLPYCTLGAGNPAAGPLGDLDPRGRHAPRTARRARHPRRGLQRRRARREADARRRRRRHLRNRGRRDFVGGDDCLHPNEAGTRRSPTPSPRRSRGRARSSRRRHHRFAPDRRATDDARVDNAPDDALDSPPDDPHAWLEDVEGERALGWVRAQRRGRRPRSPRRRPSRPARRACSPSSTPTPDPARREAGGYSTTSGRTRTTSAASGAGPRWRNTASRSRSGKRCIDLDALNKAEGRRTTRTGSGTAPTACKPDYKRCLIALSRGGSDADVTREFDLDHQAMGQGRLLPSRSQGRAGLDRRGHRLRLHRFRSRHA